MAVSGNRQLVEDVVADLEGFEIASSTSSFGAADFDVAVFDTAGLETALEAALARKREAEPELVPYLLLVSDSPDETLSVGTDGDQSSQEISTVIDAVLSMPTTTTEFAWELRNLGRQRRQSQQLAQRERQVRSKYRSLVDAVPDAVVVADAETREIVETNPAAEDLIGGSEDELRGRDIVSLHPAAEEETYTQLFASHLSEAERGSATRSRLPDGRRIRVAAADGTTIPVEINASVYEFGDRTLVTGIF
ncbi:MAG: PAS domain S-box protein [Halodesulfurarchaeum sp.]